MKELKYTVRFTTPAFLGNAEQQAQWRTPPFKALLRQWWRIAKARMYQYDHSELREAEGELFGNTWLEPVNAKSRFCKSRVLIRLESWGEGTLTSQAWPGGPMEEVTTTRDGKGRVRADVYLGFGPVSPPSRKENRPSITIRGGIAPTESAVLRFGIPERSIDELGSPLRLMQWFGGLGSRSRNGWGSLELTAIDGAPALTQLPRVEELGQICRRWQECMLLDWPHALGASNDQPLVWLTEPLSDWRKAMGRLANVRVETRRAAKSKEFIGPRGIGGIHLLGYPAGGQWELRQLRKEARLGNQLRFKVVRASESKYIGVVSHFPCRFPEILRNELDPEQQKWLNKNEPQVWRAVHDSLDRSQRVHPISE